MDEELTSRFREVAVGCAPVFGNLRESPTEALARLASQADELGVDEWDLYGDRGPVERLEREVGELLGKPAVAFFPSGVMAQQAALRAWCDRSGSRRVAMPDLSHLLVHEEDGPRRLHGFDVEHLTTGRTTPTAEHLRALVPGPTARLGAVLIELPLRDAGCLLPSWEDLVALSGTAREVGVPLHVDGARLWESQPFYDVALDEIAALVDSVYVSFYKGLGGLAGAALAGPEDLVAEARRWRRRMGGTLYHLTPYAVSALAGLRDHLPRMPEYVGTARAISAALTARGVRVQPDPPHTNTFLAHVEADADAVNERVLAFMERGQLQPCGTWRAADAPGWAVTELTVGAATLDHDPAQVAAWVAEVAAG